MNRVEASRVLGVELGAPWGEVRQAYLERIRAHHPDHAGSSGTDESVRIIEAYAFLEARKADAPTARPDPAAAATARAQARARSHVADPEPVAPPVERPRWSSRWVAPEGPVPRFARLDADTIAFAAPADEAFRWLIDVAHDIGEITYLDRSVPILEVLCRFVGEPATSLVITLQGRQDGTEAFCTAESIEARPAPPTEAVVDLLEAALTDRAEREA
ncbi:J domain-containing protein [Aquihabitans sp. G128]|uniref:J domain-containing protein n=1 Tax=Aquihabitans sp. G128 TaxID=2849779 RepID=UPI001C23D3AB|nr:J domain-containing protein [Aquihabitans sp. G128]QXC62124.1 J domain-containing protein [Aquihabitans sp. G128]